MLLDWFYKISAVVIIHSLSLVDGLEFIDALKIGVELLAQSRVLYYDNDEELESVVGIESRLEWD